MRQRGRSAAAPARGSATTTWSASSPPRRTPPRRPAPHARHAKECAAGCAGIFNSHVAIESYAEVFAAQGVLHRLEAFASFHGPDFYGLPRNTDRIRLRLEPWTGPDTLSMGSDPVIPMRAGEQLSWRVLAEQVA